MSADETRADLIERAWLAVSDFAGRHSASLATAASNPRDPAFGDDWCALVNTVAAVYAASEGHDPRLLPQGWPRPGIDLRTSPAQTPSGGAA